MKFMTRDTKNMDKGVRVWVRRRLWHSNNAINGFRIDFLATDREGQGKQICHLFTSKIQKCELK